MPWLQPTVRATNQLIRTSPGRFLRFCLHLPLFLTLVLLVASLMGRLGGMFGVQLLLRHEDFGRQLFAGLFLAFVTGACLLLGFIFEVRPRRNGSPGQQRGATTEVADRLSPAEAEGLPLAFVKYGFQIVTSVLITSVSFDFLFHLLQVRIRTALPATNPPSLRRISDAPGATD